MSDANLNWQAMQYNFSRALTASLRKRLAMEWSVPSAVLHDLRMGWSDWSRAFTFPERDAKGRIVGIQCRHVRSGNKRMLKGSKRGVYLIKQWHDRGNVILIPEGVSDTATLLAHGLAAVGRPSCSGGVKILAELFADIDTELLVIGENDEDGDGRWPGRDGAVAVAKQLANQLGREVRWALPPAGIKDIRELVSSGQPSMASGDDAGQELLDLLRRNSVAMKPNDGAEGTADAVPILANFEIEETDSGPRRRGLLLSDIRSDLYTITGGWPKRAGRDLFVQGNNDRPNYLDSPTRLFAWVLEHAHVDWHRGSDCISQEQFFASLQATAEEYESIEILPHFPHRPAVWYMYPDLPATNGSHMEQLIDFFTPSTPVDRELIKALALTLVWGGEPGHRPAFLITGPDRDPDPGRNGRGVGKSTIATILGELAGGVMTFSAREDMAGIKKRLLSPDARQLRVGLLDNLKTLRFSWDELEALITSPVISGHRMYQGEGRRSNLLTWILTLNGATLSKDMAERCVIIKLGRPNYQAAWQRSVEEFVRSYRWELINDMGCLLGSNEEWAMDNSKHGRWAQWEASVLSRVANPQKCQQLIRRRQRAVDDEQDETQLVTELLRRMIRKCRHDPDTCAVFIPTAMLAEWISNFTGERMAVTKVTPYLKTLGIFELRRRTRRSWGAGWIWQGANAPPSRKCVQLVPSLDLTSR